MTHPVGMNPKDSAREKQLGLSLGYQLSQKSSAVGTEKTWFARMVTGIERLKQTERWQRQHLGAADVRPIAVGVVAVGELAAAAADYYYYYYY